MQTRDYARGLGADPRPSAEVVEQRVRFRMERQQTAADVIVIIGEGALPLIAGTPNFVAAQAERCASSAELGPWCRAGVDAPGQAVATGFKGGSGSLFASGM